MAADDSRGECGEFGGGGGVGYGLAPFPGGCGGELCGCGGGGGGGNGLTPLPGGDGGG